jgi:Cu(I)/Ag(I) efflux system periplasmic protein CusF
MKFAQRGPTHVIAEGILIVKNLKLVLSVASLAAALSVNVAVQAASHLTDAEVRKIDKDNGKLTLRHGEIKDLDMPPMTMVFNVKNKAMLDKLQPGDKIKFKAVKEDGKFIVTEIEASK